MNKIDIEHIERELDISLPESYKTIVLKHPFVDKNKYHSVHEALLNSTSELIDINNKFRSEGIQGKKWKKDFFIIGHISMEDLFFINLSGNENVYFFDSDDKFSINIKKYKIADNLKVFVEDQIGLQEVYDIK